MKLMGIINVGFDATDHLLIILLSSDAGVENGSTLRKHISYLWIPKRLMIQSGQKYYTIFSLNFIYPSKLVRPIKMCLSETYRIRHQGSPRKSGRTMLTMLV
jgi:hypothetical protein